MKKLLCLTAAFLAATSMFSDPANAKERWIEISKSEENSVFYVDANSIEGQGRFRYFWQTVYLNRPKTGFFERPAYGVMSFESVDCQTRSYRDRTSIWIDQDGKTIERMEYGDKGKLSQANTATSQAEVLQYVCTH